MAVFDNLDKAEGLKALDQYLLSHSYIEGFAPSAADYSVFSQLSAGISKTDYPNIYRWFFHIASFPASVRSSWASSAAKAPAKSETKKAAPKKTDDDFDFDDSDDSDDGESAAAIIAKKKAEAEEAAKKKAKAAPVGKSSVILDVKPWGLEVDMAELEQAVRSIEMEGLRWAGSQLEKVAYGIMLLRINAVVIDDLVSIDVLQEKIQDLEDFVQSSDIYAFNKL